MNRLFKTLLLWLLAVMLPLHAVSAAMPMSCDPAPHPVKQVTAHNKAHPQRDMHAQHDAGAAVHHHHDSAHDQHVMADDAAPDNTANHTHHAGCSACSASCIGAAALPVAWCATPVVSESEAVRLTPTPWAIGYSPNGLDRPPRSIPV